MYNIEISTDFYEDLWNIKDYIYNASYSIEKSERVYSEIMASILTLKIFPLMYPVFRNELRVLTVRKKYRVFYKVNEDNKEVKVLYIFWTEQDYHSLIH